VEKLSQPVTDIPFVRSRSTRFDPMKPAAPVTKTFFINFVFFSLPQHSGCPTDRKLCVQKAVRWPNSNPVICFVLIGESAQQLSLFYQRSKGTAGGDDASLSAKRQGRP